MVTVKQLSRYRKTKSIYVETMLLLGQGIHVVFSWTQIGRFGFTDREIGFQIGRFFRGKKYSILVSKIVICNTVDHCKMFYLPAYCKLEVNEMCQFHSSMFWRVLYTPKCAGTLYNPYLKTYFRSILNI